MSAKAAALPVLAVALIVSLAACSREETTTVEAETAPLAPAAPATAPVMEPGTGTAMVPEMKPTGELAPSFGAAPVGSQPAAPTGSRVPEMTPTGQMKPAVNPNQPSQQAAPPAK